MDFAECLRKSENRKMDFMKGIVILVKIDEMYNIL